MTCTSTSGITISSTERPNMVCGNSRLIRARLADFEHLRREARRLSAAAPGAAGLTATASAPSIRLEGIAGAAHRLQIARIARIGLDLAPQPRHLHIDVADVAAELRRLRQLLARHRLPGPRRQARQQRPPRRRSGAPDRRRGTARRVPGRSGTRRTARCASVSSATGRRSQDVADPQHQLARLERLREVIVGAAVRAR